jgi:hypothetical protein
MIAVTVRLNLSMAVTLLDVTVTSLDVTVTSLDVTVTSLDVTVAVTLGLPPLGYVRNHP